MTFLKVLTPEQRASRPTTLPRLIRTVTDGPKSSQPEQGRGLVAKKSPSVKKNALTRRLMHSNVVCITEQRALILGETPANENANILPDNAVLWHTCVLERLKRAFEQQALLGVEAGRFLRRHGEEWRVKETQVTLQEVPSLGVERSRLSRVRVVEWRRIEAGLGRDGREARTCTGTHFPELGGRRHVSGKPAREAHDGDGHQRL